MHRCRRLALGLVAVSLQFVFLSGCDPQPQVRSLDTVAGLEVIRPAVEVKDQRGSHAIAASERLAPGTEIRVADRARALLRHDGGAHLLLDGGATLSIDQQGLRLSAGRLWADVGPGATVDLLVPGFALTAGGAGAAFELKQAGGAPQLTVIRGEVGWRAEGNPKTDRQRGVVAAGQGAGLSGGAAQVGPVALWDDWTGGLGWPDPRQGRGAAGVGEIGARRPGDLGEARFPLSIQRLQVRTRIEDDLAITTVEQTFFNPAEATLEGIYRVRVPEGAILSRFAIDRRGQMVDGYVKERETARKQYQEQVYQGSTHDPALLEWEAPGSYKARLYPLPPGSTRRVLITYTEWLTPYGDGGGLRAYRYPMAGSGALASRPLIQELDLEVDAARAGADEIRAGLGAILGDHGRVVLQRTDYLPTADFLVELSSQRREPSMARGYRAQHVIPSHPGGASSRHPEDDYVLVRALPVPAPPAGEREPLDVVLVVDVSAATDVTHLAMARTMAESLLRHLSPDDRVTLLGADLDLHGLAPETPAPGKSPRPPKGNRRVLPPLEPATPEIVTRLLGGLGQVRTGGATDLGAVLGQAQGLLDPARLGGVVYIGDALPTVGELDLTALRERLDRLPAPLRLYGVGVGAEADLGLLSGLCQQSAGLAFRIADRAAAAEAALGIIGHLSRPAAARVSVEAGPGVDRVYPRLPVSVTAGEVLPVLARVRKGVPAQIKLSGVFRGRPFTQTFSVQEHKLDDTADLRLRWSQARLQQLLQSGASTEEVAELGVRQDLITPYTSFYVPSEDEISLLERQVPDLRAAGCSRGRPEGAAPVMITASSAPEQQQMAQMAERRRPAGEPSNQPAAPPPPPSPSAAAAPGAAADAPMEMKKEAGDYRPKKPMAPRPEKSALRDDLDGLADGEGGSGTARAADKSEKLRSATMDTKNAAVLGVLGAGSGGKDRALGGLFGHRAGGDGYLANKVAGPAGAAHAQLAKGKKASKHGHRADPADPLLGLGLDAEQAVTIPVVEVHTGDTTVVVGIQSHRPRGCSAASQLPLDDRLDLWRERLSGAGVTRALEVWQDAVAGCELRRWTDRRELLRQLLRAALASGGPSGMVQLYGHFGDSPEEQDFLRRAILGEVRTPRDLRVIYDGLGLQDEERLTLAQEVVRKAKTQDERLLRLEELLQRWPGDMRLRLWLMESQELSGQGEAARRTAELVRQDLYADAQARTAVGELYLRLGDESAARRAFSEIVEFAPRDPLARRRLGDLYRAHGWFDEAYRQYQTLLVLAPSDLSVLLLQAAAAAGAGHLEEALGLEARVASTAEPGSEVGLPRVALWLSGLRLALLRQDAREKNDVEELARLLARARRTGMLGLSRPVRVFLTWAHPEADLELAVAAPGEAPGSPTQVSPELGLLGWDSGKEAPPGGDYRFEVRRGEGAGAALRHEAELVVLVGEGTPQERAYRKVLQVSAEQPVQRFALRQTGLEVQ